MPPERVVVEAHLAVERQPLTGAGQDEGVDLGQGGILGDVGGVELLGDGGEAVDLISGEAEREADRAHLIGMQAEEGIGQLLAHYKAALEGRDLDALKRIWPGLTPASANAIREQFQDATRLTVGILEPRISASGTSGTVTFRRRYEIQTRDGQNLRNETHTTMTVRRTSAGWVIESIRFSAAR